MGKNKQLMEAELARRAEKAQVGQKVTPPTEAAPAVEAPKKKGGLAALADKAVATLTGKKAEAENPPEADKTPAEQAAQQTPSQSESAPQAEKAPAANGKAHQTTETEAPKAKVEEQTKSQPETAPQVSSNAIETLRAEIEELRQLAHETDDRAKVAETKIEAQQTEINELKADRAKAEAMVVEIMTRNVDLITTGAFRRHGARFKEKWDGRIAEVLETVNAARKESATAAMKVAVFGKHESTLARLGEIADVPTEVTRLKAEIKAEAEVYLAEMLAARDEIAKLLGDEPQPPTADAVDPFA